MITTSNTRGLVEHFWQTMETNDWDAAGRLLHDDFTLDWPQSRERIRGRDNFVAINAAYPAAGRWSFTLNRLIAEGPGAVSDVSVSDGVLVARAISFFELRDDRIWRMTEYWPDPYPSPAWRSAWVEPLP